MTAATIEQQTSCTTTGKKRRPGKTPEERAAEVEALAEQLTPVRRRFTTEEAAERARTGQRPAFDADGRPAMVVRGFRLERVFRYEDTEGEPLPQEPEVGYITGDTPVAAWDALAALVARDGYQLTAEAEDA